MKKIEPKEINQLVEIHRGVINAVVAVECTENKVPSTYRANWIFNSDVCFSMFEVVKKSEEFTAPFICVMNYETKWGCN